MAEGQKRILAVGGIDKNIPKWILRAFEVEHYEQQSHFKKEIAPKDRPDVVIVLKSWISHKQCADAREFAQANNIPFIISDGGWSMAVQRAIEGGLDWFAHAVDKSLTVMPPDESTEADATLERAWEGAYKREHEKAHALEKRLKKEREKLEDALRKLDIAEKKENAASRVISEVHEAARVTKTRQDEIIRLVKQLVEHRDVLKVQSGLIDNVCNQLETLLKSAGNKD